VRFIQRIRSPWIVLCVLALIGVSFAAVNPAAAQISQTCFTQTSFCVEGRIGQFWSRSGGLVIFGYPIGPQEDMQIDGKTYTVQWFERARIELHPENEAPFDVLLGRVGAERLTQTGRSWEQFPKSQPQPGCQFVPETGHNVCGQALETWQSFGLDLYGQPGVSVIERLGLWGLPLSDLTTETLSDGRQYQVQWFERARLELHPENPIPFKVLGGLLGSEVYVQQHQIAAPTPVPTPLPPPSRACTATPSSERSVYRKGVLLTASSFHFYDEIADVPTTPQDDFLTMNVLVGNELYQRPDGSPARIFVNVDSLTLVDTAGRSYTPDGATGKLGDRFVSGQVQSGDVRIGRLAFRIPKDAIPDHLVYDGYTINPEFPRVRLSLNWPGC